MAMTDKRALITGATNGIGKQIALELARAGVVVMIAGRSLKLSQGLRQQAEVTR